MQKNSDFRKIFLKEYSVNKLTVPLNYDQPPMAPKGSRTSQNIFFGKFGKMRSGTYVNQKSKQKPGK